MDILFATHNNHKVKEIKEVFSDVRILTLDELNDEDEVAETGKTFAENAGLKARYYYRKYKIPVIADDSGLLVTALNDEPGVHSARYSVTGSYADNNKLLLQRMNNITNRSAYFITVICFIDANGQEKYFTGKIEGIITEQLQGTSGFGYDPLFLVPNLNKTFAEMSLAEKNEISHRALALKEFAKHLQSIILKDNQILL